MGGLALSKVGYDRYLKFVWPFVAAAFVVVVRVRRRRGRPELNRGEEITVAAPSTTTRLGVALGGRHAAQRHRPPPDLAHERLSPTQLPRAAVRRRDLGAPRAAGVRRVRRPDARARRRGAAVPRAADRDARATPTAREWVLQRKLRPEEVTAMFSRELTAWMTEMPAEELATRLTGGVTLAELPADIVTAVGRALRPTDFVLAPAARTSCSCATRARGSTAASSINSMFWPARQHETLNLEAVYRFHPRFRDAGFPIWFGGVDHDWGTRDDRGRRHHARRRRRRARRPGRAQQRARGQHPRPEPVRRRRGAAGDRRADAARRARRCTSTPCSRSATATSRRSTSRSSRRSCRSCYRPDGDGGVQRRGLRALVHRRGQGRARARRT